MQLGILSITHYSLTKGTTQMPHFIKLTLIDGDERIINTNVILDIDEENQSISTSLTNEFFNGEIYLTKTSMAHLLSNIDWV